MAHRSSPVDQAPYNLLELEEKKKKKIEEKLERPRESERRRKKKGATNVDRASIVQYMFAII